MTGKRLSSAIALLVDGRALVTGGENWDGLIHSSSELAASDLSRVQQRLAMTIPRDLHTATVLADGRVLIVGGGIPSRWRPGNVVTNATEIFDSTAASFTAGPSLHAVRMNHTVTLLTDGVLFDDRLTYQVLPE